MKFLFELNLGYNVGMQGGDWGGSPKIDLKIGYAFYIIYN
jgi:hypothetical protein